MPEPTQNGVVRKMGRYIVGETLGEGAFSKVRLGIDEETGERVALKILKTGSALSQSTQRQVEREIAAMAKIDHCNTINLKEVDWNAVYTKKNGKKVPCILVVLELATGGELFEFLAVSGSFEESISRTYFNQLMEGVQHCHTQGVVHRDLKPENLLLDKEFVLKIADFGFSEVFEQTAAMNTACGTPGYMAPEMFAAGSYDGAKADIWACGVILFIMSAGFPPFQKPNTTDWWFHKLANNKQHLFWRAHERNATFSDEFKDLVNRILSPDPDTRASMNEILSHPWFQGEHLNGASLFEELLRRKGIVDRHRIREREAKQAAQAGAGGAITNILVRDIGGDGAMDLADDALPPCPPRLDDAFGFYSPTDISSGSPHNNLRSRMSNLNSGFMSLESVLQATPSHTPPSYDAKNALACYTSFYSNANPNKILKRLEGLLSAMGSKFSCKDQRFRIKANFNLKSSGPVTLTINVFSNVPEAEDGSYLIEVRRRKGDSSQFRSLFNQIRSELSDLVAPAVA